MNIYFDDSEYDGQFLSLLRNRGLASKDVLLDLAGGCFSASLPIGDVKSSKALHRYNVVKTPAVGVITV